jgi:hypothetical protein
VDQGGYVTGTQVTVQTSSLEGGVTRNFAGSTVFPKPVAVTVCAKVSQPDALRDWALKNGAATAGDPAWVSAQTEIVVTPESADDGVILNLLPKITATGADGVARDYPVRVCATSVLIKRGTPATFDGFPGSDPDFYRLFMAAEESTQDALASITVAAGVQYVGQPGDK